MTFQWREVCIPAAAGGEPKENVTDSGINNSRGQHGTRRQDLRWQEAWAISNPARTSLYHLSKPSDGNGTICIPGGFWWPLRQSRSWCPVPLHARAGRGWGPKSLMTDSTPLCFLPLFPTFAVWPSRGEALGVTSVPAGLTQLRFSKNMYFLYCWPLTRLISEYKQSSHKTTVIAVPSAIYFYCANHSWLF